MSVPTSRIADVRLRNQKLTHAPFAAAENVVSWLGAVQSQDFAGAKWGVAIRMKQATDATLNAAFDEGRILRTHVMRPTWHFVSPADIRWMLALTGPRVHAVSKSYYRKQELDDQVFARSQRAFERALRDGKHLTRAELGAVLRSVGISWAPLRLIFIVLHAELDGIICSGPLRGKQFTYALLEERVPAVKPLTRDEAIAELTTRYFTSHGPATVRDFVWWSGLTVRDAKAGIEMIKPALVHESVGDLTYWRSPASSTGLRAGRTTRPVPPSLHLLPNYDEYLIAYRDRQVMLDKGQPLPAAMDPYAYYLIINGRLRGTWRKAIEPKRVRVTVTTFTALTRKETRQLEAEAARFGAFVGLPVVLESKS
jgi:Winged helix DNA-binding domain